MIFAPPYRIHLVESSAKDLKELEETLLSFSIRKDIEIDKSTSFENALEKLKETFYHILFINLDGLDPHEVLGQIRPKSPGTRVVLMSPKTSMVQIINCFQDGAIDFIPIPFKEKDLEACFENLMANIHRWRDHIHHFIKGSD